jgi:hypothetical protein
MTKAELKRLKVATEKLTKWETSGKAFGHYQVIEAKATTKDGADSIYEFWCLMKILDDLRVNYKITLIPGIPVGKIFPQAPSLKKGWPYFKIELSSDPTNKYQVCYGTKIKLSLAPKTTIAPDISVQKHDASDDPDESMVELIMDAKFKYRNTDTLPIEQIHAFMQRVNALQTQNANVLPLKFSVFTNIKSNCLLTNGQALADQEEYCILNNIKQVEQFDITSTYNVIG